MTLGRPLVSPDFRAAWYRSIGATAGLPQRGRLAVKRLRRRSDETIF
jgi:hypothetical protein